MNVIPTSGVTWGFQASDIFSNAQYLVTGVAGFVVLLIALMFAPKLVSFIKGIFGKSR